VFIRISKHLKVTKFVLFIQEAYFYYSSIKEWPSVIIYCVFKSPIIFLRYRVQPFLIPPFPRLRFCHIPVEKLRPLFVGHFFVFALGMRAWKKNAYNPPVGMSGKNGIMH